MSVVQPFVFNGHELRTISINGEPWFIAADVSRILGYRMASDMTRRLDAEDKGTRSVRTRSGEQDMTVINEAGLYDAVLGSKVTDARTFKRWVTHDVLPAIRKTGSFSSAPAPSGPELLALAVLEAQSMIAAKDERIAALAPSAEAWDTIASATGDYSVGDAAKMLARAGVETGPQRLFQQLSDMGWLYRAGDGKWRVYAGVVDKGYMAEKPQSHHHPVSGDLVLDAPQVRVTLRGVERLRVRMGVLSVVAS